MKDLSPSTETGIVKYGLGRYVARNLHPVKARRLIYQGTKKALERLKAGEIKPVKIPEPPIVLELHFPDTGAADAASMMPGVERVDGLVTKFVTDDMREAYKAFYAQTRMQRSRLLP